MIRALGFAFAYLQAEGTTKGYDFAAITGSELLPGGEVADFAEIECWSQGASNCRKHHQGLP